MKFYRIDDLPPYVFATVDAAEARLRREGRDVVDLGFGNPISRRRRSPSRSCAKPPPARQPPLLPRAAASSSCAGRSASTTHAASASPSTRDAGRQHDSAPRKDLLTCCGCSPAEGDNVVVPTPAYPIHRVAPRLAGATVVDGPRRGRHRRDRRRRRGVPAASRDRLVPAQPDDGRRDGGTTCSGSSTSRASATSCSWHDFAYADIAFDGHEPPSVLQAEGADECAVELYSLTKSFSMAGWRVGFVSGRADVVQALAKLKSYLDYGTFQPIQIASIVALRDTSDYPVEVCDIYRSRRDALCTGLARAGWDVEPPRGTMFVWASIPDAFSAEGSLGFALRLAQDASVAVSPGVGFGEGGDGHVRFALVENEQRIAQACRSIRKLLAG
jgi:alanine-synthesizing transaminase